MSKNKILNYLGLSKRAGFLISGSELVEKALKKNKLQVLVLADNVSESNLKDFEKLASDKKVRIIKGFTETELSDAIGSKRKIMGITDAGIANKIIELMEEVNG